MLKSLLPTIVLLGMTFSAVAQSMPNERTKALLDAVGRPAMSYEEAIGEFSQSIRIYDLGGDGLTVEDLDLAEAIAAASLRAQAAMNYLHADLNNDLEVTSEELAILARTGRSGLRVMSFDEIDVDGNGKLDWSEMTSWPPGDQVARVKPALLAKTLDIDPTPDTPFTIADATMLAEELFAFVDTNNDRLIDADEFKAARSNLKPKRPRPAGRAEQDNRCDAPRPTASDEVVVIGIYEGEAYASNFLGGPDDPTYVVEVTVEPGERPLYVVGTSLHSVIWKFIGATERLRHVLLSGVYVQGATGVEKGAVSFEGDGDCFHRTDDLLDANDSRVQEIAGFVGKTDFRRLGIYSLFAASIPSMTPASAPKSGRFENPMIAVDAASIIAQTLAQPYQVLPGRAGLAQLLANGSLAKEKGETYRIVKPIPHFPADLHGAKAVTFIVANGVPIPSGSAGHSCVRVEDTGEATPRLCR